MERSVFNSTIQQIVVEIIKKPIFARGVNRAFFSPNFKSKIHFTDEYGIYDADPEIKSYYLSDNLFSQDCKRLVGYFDILLLHQYLP